MLCNYVGTMHYVLSKENIMNFPLNIKISAALKAWFLFQTTSFVPNIWEMQYYMKLNIWGKQDEREN